MWRANEGGRVLKPSIVGVEARGVWRAWMGRGEGNGQAGQIIWFEQHEGFGAQG